MLGIMLYQVFDPNYNPDERKNRCIAPSEYTLFVCPDNY